MWHLKDTICDTVIVAENIYALNALPFKRSVTRIKTNIAITLEYIFFACDFYSFLSFLEQTCAILAELDLRFLCVNCS